MTSFAAQLGTFAASAPAATIPVAVREHGAMMLLDLLGASAGGFETDLARIARASAVDLFGTGAIGVWFSDQRSSLIGAAFANSSAASALDIDDGHRGAAGHAGAAVVPAALAVAAQAGRSGAELLDAIILGYDVALRIGAARPIAQLDRFNSGPWAVFGAAVAAGRLMGLNGTKMTQAIAIAGAEAPAGLALSASTRFDSTVKEGMPWAVVAGLGGAIRARHGGTGPEDLLDSANHYDHAALLAGLGEDWLITDTYLKPYACCRYIHSALDAIGEMAHPDLPVKSLHVGVFPQALKLPNQRAPRTLEDAQFSLPFCCAVAAIHGSAALQPLNAALLRDRRVLDLAARIEMSADPAFAYSFPATTPARVRLERADGGVERVVVNPLGDVANPMSHAQVEAKFRHLSAAKLPLARQDAVLSALASLADGPVQPLFDALTTRDSIAT